MIGAVAKLAWRVAWAPADVAARLALDVLFGKPEEFEFPLTGTSPSPLDRPAAARDIVVTITSPAPSRLTDRGPVWEQLAREDVREWCR